MSAEKSGSEAFCVGISISGSCVEMREEKLFYFIDEDEEEMVTFSLCRVVKKMTRA